MKTSLPAIIRSVMVVLLVLGPAFACRPEDQRTDSVDPMSGMQQRESWDPAMTAQLDSGNAAVRADRFEEARRHFLAVTEMEPDVAAGWFGLYLSEQGLGNEEAAMEALERSRSLAAGATLLHPSPEDTAR